MFFLCGFSYTSYILFSYFIKSCTFALLIFKPISHIHFYFIIFFSIFAPNQNIMIQGYQRQYKMPTFNSESQKAREAISYLQTKGFTRNQAAAIIGTFRAESHLKLDAYNEAEANGLNSAVKKNEYGIGIGQWTGPRHVDFVNYVHDNGGVADLKTQLDFTVHEMQTKYPEFYKNLKSTDDLELATKYMYVQYTNANYRNVNESNIDSYVNKVQEKYRKKHEELYGIAGGGDFDKRIHYALNSMA